jgi:hypothetical protein
LALSFIELGEKVLLFQGGIRRPVVAGLMSVKSGLGLRNVLADRAIAGEAVHNAPVENLFVLASRTARDDETLPRSADLPNVPQDLSAHFDRMVVDGPPALATADTGLLAVRGHIDVLHVHLGHGGSVIRKALPLSAARLAGVPAVVHGHSHDFGGWFDRLPPAGQRAVRRLLAAEHWVVLGERHLEEYASRLQLTDCPDPRAAQCRPDSRYPGRPIRC